MWLGLVLTNLEFDPIAEHCHKIQMSWYIHVGRGGYEMVHYYHWNQRPTMKWKPHPMYVAPVWCDSNSMCNSQKPCGKKNSKIYRPEEQIKFEENNLHQYEGT